MHTLKLVRSMSLLYQQVTTSTPTPVMEDVIDNKHEINDLYGPGYYIEDVKYIMCFRGYDIYCIHPNTTTAPLGEPHSMGCVRMVRKMQVGCLNVHH